MRRMQIAYAIDWALLGVCAYLVAQHPGWKRVGELGLVDAVRTLPTPLNPANATGFFIPTDRAPTVTEVTVQEWFNYVLGEDLGAGSETMPQLAYFQATNKWKNELVLPAAIRENLPHVLAIWMRNMLAGWALYFGVGGLWAWWIYRVRGEHYFPARKEGAPVSDDEPEPRTMPSWRDMRIQIGVSAHAMVFYTLAPTVSEWVVERGWTHTYGGLGDLGAVLGPLGSLAGGLPAYALLFCAYMLLVEWAIYWIHRWLHIPILYKLLHKPHVSTVLRRRAGRSLAGRLWRPMAASASSALAASLAERLPLPSAGFLPLLPL